MEMKHLLVVDSPPPSNRDAAVKSLLGRLERYEAPYYLFHTGVGYPGPLARVVYAHIGLDAHLEIEPLLVSDNPCVDNYKKLWRKLAEGKTNLLFPTKDFVEDFSTWVAAEKKFIDFSEEKILMLFLDGALGFDFDFKWKSVERFW